MSAEMGELEKLALRLYFTYLDASGDILRFQTWIPNAPAEGVVAHAWMKLEPHEREVWLAVARRAQELLP